MKTRRTFLTGVAAGGAAMLLAAQSTEAAPSPTPKPMPAPKPSPTPSPAALETARQMRAFDPHLTDADVATIASGLDDGNRAGGRLNPKGRLLKNWDEPVTHFAARVNETQP